MSQAHSVPRSPTLVALLVLIVGAPRSGTSMLQKVLRNHPQFWSLPSESDMIWDQFCHPALRGWESECMDESDLITEERDQILNLFESYTQPASFWRPFESTNLIWGFRRVPALRKVTRASAPVFVPRGLVTTLRHRWEFRDPVHGWKTTDVISFEIRGGREKGYRGYTVKERTEPGAWRIRVESSDGRILGSMRFDVVDSNATRSSFRRLIMTSRPIVRLLLMNVPSCLVLFDHQR